MFCTNCGTPQAEGTRFCTNCGHPMAALNSTSAAPAQPVAEAPVQPVAEAPVQPVAEAPAQPVAEAPAQPVAEIPAQPVAEVPAQPVAEVPAQPVAEAPVQPMAEVPAQPVAEVPAQPVAEAPAQPVAEAPAQPVAEAPVQPVAQAPAQPFAQAPAQPAWGASAPPPAGMPAQPGFGVPANAAMQPAFAAAPPPNAKKRNKAVLWLILGLVVVLAAIGVALYFIFFKGGNTRSQIEKAFDQTFNRMEKEWDDANLDLGVATVLKNLSKVPTSTEMEFNFTDSYDEEFGFSLTAQSDATAEKFIADIIFNMGRSKALTLNLQQDGDLLAFSMPQLFDGMLGLNTATLADDLRNSPLAASSPELASLFETYAGLLANATLNSASTASQGFTFSNDTTDQLSKLYNTLLDNATYEKGKATTTSVNGIDTKVQPYTVTITKDNLLAFIKDAAQVILNDENFKAYMESTLTASSLTGISFDAATIAETITTNLEPLIASDLTVDFYQKDDYIAKVEASIQANDGYSENLTIVAGAEFGGEKNIADAIKLYAGIKEQKTYLTLSMAGNHIPQNGIMTSKVAFSAETAGMKSDIVTIDFTLDTNKNNAYSLSLNSPITFITLDASGTIKADAKNNTLDLTIDDLSFSDGYDVWGLSFSLNMEEGSTPSIGTLKPRMIFEMTADELNTLMMDMEDRLWDIYYELY